MRVAYVAYAYPVLTQTFTVREVAALRRHGLDVQVFAVRSDPGARLDPLAERERGSARYLTLGEALRAAPAALLRRPGRFLSTLRACLGGGYRDDALRCRLRAPFHFLLGAALARRLAREGGYGRVHAQFVDAGSTVAYAAARLAGLPFSFANHTAYNPYLLPAKARQADRVVSITAFDRERVLSDCGGEVAGKLVVCRVGIDLSAWSDVPREPEPGRVLVVGALREKKGHDVLIDAAARLGARGRAVRLRFAGTGAEDAALRERARRLGVAVDFLGAVGPEAVREELRRAEVFALPCRVARNGDLDGLPVALMEAMAAGVPVVSTRLSGIPELVEDGVSGLLCGPDDPVGLAEALGRLLADPELARRLARGGRERVAELHDIARTSADLAAVLAGAPEGVAA